MKNNIVAFKYNEQQVRTIEKNGEPWFVGKDVADILGYSDTAQAVRKHIDNEDKGVVEMTTPVASSLLPSSTNLACTALSCLANCRRRRNSNTGLLPRFFRLSARPANTRSHRHSRTALTLWSATAAPVKRRCGCVSPRR